MKQSESEWGKMGPTRHCGWWGKRINFFLPCSLKSSSSQCRGRRGGRPHSDRFVSIYLLYLPAFGNGVCLARSNKFCCVCVFVFVFVQPSAGVCWRVTQEGRSFTLKTLLFSSTSSHYQFSVVSERTKQQQRQWVSRRWKPSPKKAGAINWFDYKIVPISGSFQTKYHGQGDKKSSHKQQHQLFPESPKPSCHPQKRNAFSSSLATN